MLCVLSMVGTFKECGDSVYIADQSVSYLLSIKYVHQMSSLLQNASDTIAKTHAAYNRAV